MVRNIQIQEQIIKKVMKSGNSGSVYTPSRWIGEEVIVILPKKPRNLKEEILNLISPHSEHIIGVFLTGSHARKEETEHSDIDLIIVSDKPLKLKKHGYHIINVTLEQLMKTIEKNPILIFPLIKESKGIINSKLLKELKNIKINPKNFRWFMESTRSSLKIVENLISMEKEGKLEATGVIYSLVLRLRGIYLMKCILKNKKYSAREFKEFVYNNIKKEIFDEMYGVYRAERDNKRILAHKISLENAKKLYFLVATLVNKEGEKLYGKKKRG